MKGIGSRCQNVESPGSFRVPPTPDPSPGVSHLFPHGRPDRGIPQKAVSVVPEDVHEFRMWDIAGLVPMTVRVPGHRRHDEYVDGGLHSLELGRDPWDHWIRVPWGRGP